MRRGTLITIVALFVLLLVAAISQIRAGTGTNHRYPGPGYVHSNRPSVPDRFLRPSDGPFFRRSNVRGRPSRAREYGTLC